jgi:hypothetical protein
MAKMVNIEAAIRLRQMEIASLRRVRATLKRLATHDEWTDEQRTAFHRAQDDAAMLGVHVPSDFTYLSDLTIS